MKKSLIIGTMLTITALTGCATTSKSATNQQSVAKMQVAPIKLNFTQRHQNSPFYDESALQKLLTACIQDELSKAGKLSTDSTSPTLAINLDYQRSHIGTYALTKQTITGVWFEFDYQITQNGQVLQTKQVKNRLVDDFDPNTTYTAQDSERQLITNVCQDIVKTIK